MKKIYYIVFVILIFVFNINLSNTQIVDNLTFSKLKVIAFASGEQHTATYECAETSDYSDTWGVINGAFGRICDNSKCPKKYYNRFTLKHSECTVTYTY